MKKILGLDIGTNSIGWALVHEPQNSDGNYSIAGLGVRIIPLSPDENDEFTKGNAISKNAKRTLKRGTRRNLHRYKLRRHQLKVVSQSLGMMPDKALFEIDALTLYGLRVKGVSEQLTLPEIGRIFFHLNQKRGYKSNRKANNEENEPETINTEGTSKIETKPKKKGYLDVINDREQSLKEEGLTIGQHFHQMLSVDPFYRIKENIYLRSTYINEFDRIWDKQQTYYPDVLTEANKHKIRNEIIYYQRPLRSQKGLVNDCLFEKRHKAIPKSSPLFQVAKIWQELNNIELTSFKALRGKEEGFKQGKRLLTLNEKQKLFDLLNIKGKLSVKDCLKELGYQSGFDEYKLNIRNEKELEGNRTCAAIKKVLDQFKVNCDHLLQFDLPVIKREKTDKQTGEILTKDQIDPNFESQSLYQLWHLLYSIEETEPLIATLQKRYGFTSELATVLSKIDLIKQGYGSLSAKALRNILPYLKLGYDYSKACKLAGYNHSASLTKDENESRKIDDKLELYPKNSLRQPVVEKIVNQVINLVNQIIDEKNGFITNDERHNGAFEIRVELARELRQSTEERNKTYSRNSKQNRRHKEIEDILKNELDFKRVSRNDIERYKLWEEFNYMSPYEPNKPVSLTEVFNLVSGNFYDIEHIIPKSRLFDDSFTNKTICPRRLNSGVLGKNQMTAYDYMESKGDQALNDYIAFLKMHLTKISKAKFNKLMMPVNKIPDNFINRQLQETRFITKEVSQLLSKISRNVHLTSGSVTDYLRHHWGYDFVLQRLNWHKYEGLNKTIIESDKHGKPLYRIIDWSKRDDHRHHAIDALVIACTKQGYIQQLNNLNKTIETRYQQTNQDAIKEIDIKTQVPFTFQNACDAVNGILISFKPGKKVYSTSVNRIRKGKKIIYQAVNIIPRGSLHQETVYGRIKRYEEIPLSGKFNRLEDMVYPEPKKLVLEHLKYYNNDFKEAFKEKNLLNFENQTGFKKVIVYQYEYVVRYKLDVNFNAANVEKIVDQRIKEKVKSHLAQYDNNPKEALKNGHEYTVWLNKDKGIPIKSVRCFARPNDLTPLHKNEKDEFIDFVSLQNNHHISVYKDRDGKLHDKITTFWDAVKRKQNKLPVIIKHPAEIWDKVLNLDIDDQNFLQNFPDANWIFVASLQQNEMFILGLSKDEIEKALDENNQSLLSAHLYLTWSISESDYWFRHHLETKNSELKTTPDAKEAKRYYRFKSLGAFIGAQPTKVKVGYLGNISLI